MNKNNSMNNFMNHSYKQNNNTNIKLIPKTNSLKNINNNTYKIKRNSNSFYNTNSKPIKIKANTGNSFSFDNQNSINQQNTLEQENHLNNMIQEYNYFKYLYDYSKYNNGKNKFKSKSNIKRPTTAPHKNKNKKEMIIKQNISLNNSNKIINDYDNDEKIFNFYGDNNSNNKSIQSQIGKKQEKILDDIDIYNKIYKHSENRPPSPIIKPNIRINNY